MKPFLNDIWDDLREKRLWPVAVVLLLGLVAVPVVLSKPADDGSAPAPTAAAARKAPDPKGVRELTAVKLDESADESSTLDTFDPSNPFRPPESVVKADHVADGSGGSSGPSTGSDSAPTPSSGGGSGSPDTGGGSGGSTPTNGGGDTGGGDDGSGTTTTTQYRYVADVTLAVNGHTRRIKSLERLDMLPSEDKPLLLFLGVDPDGSNAVMLVDSTLTAAGEGTCKPSNDECAFLHIGAGSEHEFTNEAGDSYTLRINEIRKVKVEAKSARSSRAKRHSKASAAVGAARHRFTPELLSDLVSVSSDGAQTSNPDSDRR